ncbi:hypothetical protein Tco_0126845 [Tanacetum coccineum]
MDVGLTLDPLSPAIDAFVDRWVVAPAPSLPPPLPLSPLSSPLPRITSPPLLLPPPTHRYIILEANMPPQKRARFTASSHRFEIWEISIAAAARQPRFALIRGTKFGFVTALEEVNERVTDLATNYRQDSHELILEYYSSRGKMMNVQRDRSREDARDPEHHDGLVDADTQWFEKMESVFHISNCTMGCPVKFATCTLLGGALTWWNSHVRTVRHHAAYGMPWKTLMKMITENYCSRSEIKKLEIKLWNLVIKGTDVESYT